MCTTETVCAEYFLGLVYYLQWGVYPISENPPFMSMLTETVFKSAWSCLLFLTLIQSYFCNCSVPGNSLFVRCWTLRSTVRSRESFKNNVSLLIFTPGNEEDSSFVWIHGRWLKEIDRKYPGLPHMTASSIIRLGGYTQQASHKRQPNKLSSYLCWRSQIVSCAESWN